MNYVEIGFAPEWLQCAAECEQMPPFSQRLLTIHHLPYNMAVQWFSRAHCRQMGFSELVIQIAFNFFVNLSR